jgi:AcrR family transcriptional regulator
MVLAMARTGPTRAEGVRRRPKDRKAQIARASAEAFSTLGYYGVSMETIAKRVGISAAALYRHYSSKYELFRDAVLNLGQQLVDCTEFADEASGDPELTLRRLVSALIDTAMINRESGGLYRWEGRYLSAAVGSVDVGAVGDRQYRRSPRQAARHPGAGVTRRPRRHCAGRRPAGRGGQCRRGPPRRRCRRAEIRSAA